MPINSFQIFLYFEHISSWSLSCVIFIQTLVFVISIYWLFWWRRGFKKKNDCIALIAHTRMRGCPAHFYLFKTVGSDPNLNGGTCFAIKSKKKCLTKLFNAIHFSKPNMFESLKLFSSLTPKTYFTLGLLGLYGIYKTLTKHYKKSALFLLCFSI